VLKRNGGLEALDKPEMEKLYTEAFVRTNNALRVSAIDDSLSGTTGITVVVKGEHWRHATLIVLVYRHVYNCDIVVLLILLFLVIVYNMIIILLLLLLSLI
jgi:hypothetical protein